MQQGEAGTAWTRALWKPAMWAGQSHPPWLRVRSGRSLETPSQLAAVPRPLWFSVTPPSRTTRTSRILDTGAPPRLPALLPTSLPRPSPSIVPRSTEFGMYQPHCGLENVLMSWGHDGEAGWRWAAGTMGTRWGPRLWEPGVTPRLPQSTCTG